MKVLAASIEDVFREAAARWTLIAYFFLSSIFLLIFASAINLDIVDGALAGAKLFGKEVEMRNEISIEKLVLGFESGFSAVLYFLCTFMAIFATAHLVPRLQEKGTIDLYLSRPVSRVGLLMSRYVAGLILAATPFAETTHPLRRLATTLATQLHDCAHGPSPSGSRSGRRIRRGADDGTMLRGVDHHSGSGKIASSPSRHSG